MTEEELFHAVLSQPPAERSAFLERACSGNPTLRMAVEARLTASTDPGSSLSPERTLVAPKESEQTVVQPADFADDEQTAVMTELVPGSGDARDGGISPLGTTNFRPDSAVGAVIGGRYTLQRKLGEGGMGEVWGARQTAPVKREVALKLIKTGMDSRAVLQRFEQERQALALMDHPNIARVLDGGVTPTGQPYFVMELVQGLPLTRYCDELQLPLQERLELFVPICQAVQHAHQKGIVHRDLKPANILVTTIDGRPVPKVIDFGVAKATSGKLTEETMSTGFGAVVGTLEYMSPEQAGWDGEDIDTRADIYSLGVILYELLTGLRPIDSRRLKKAAFTEMIRIIREEEPSKPSTRLSTDESLPSLATIRQMEPKRLTALLRGELDWVVMKCLEKQRERRYESAAALARDIQRYLSNEEVEARPPSAGYRMRKFVSRNRGQVAAVSAVAASLLIGLVGFAWQARVANDQRDLAKRATIEETRQKTAATMARDAEALARQQTEVALDESRTTSARMIYERAQALCEQGQADLGLLWMARGLDMTPARSPDLERAIRTSLNLWAAQLTTPHPSPSQWQRDNLPPVEDLSVSPDESSLVVAGRDGLVRILDATTGKQRSQLPLENDAPPREVMLGRVAVTRDGRLVAATRGDRNVRIWDLTEESPVGRLLAHDEPVVAVGFDPSGKMLATAAGRQIGFWDPRLGAPAGAPWTLSEAVTGLVFSEDGRRLVVWGNNQFQIWEAASKTLLQTVDGLDFEVFDVACSPDGKHVIASGKTPGSDVGTRGLTMAQFWDIDSGKPVGSRMRWEYGGPAGRYFRSAFQAGGRVVVTGGLLRLWEVPSGRSLGTLGSDRYGNWPVFSRDGKRLFGASPRIGTDQLETWPTLDIAPRLLPMQRLTIDSSEGYFWGLDIGPDGRTAVISQTGNQGDRESFSLYDLQTGTRVAPPWWMELPQGMTNNLLRPAYSSDGRHLAVAVGTNACQIIDTATAQEAVPGLEMGASVRALAFSPDGRFLAGGDLDGHIQIWDTQTGKPVGPPWKQDLAINVLRFRADGCRLLAAGGLPNRRFGEARVWDVATSAQSSPALKIDGAVHDAAFSPAGTTFATGAFDLVLWNAESVQRLWTAPVFEVTTQLAFSPDGRHVLARQLGDASARLYDSQTGEPTSPKLSHPAELNSATFSPDGRLVLTCSNDGTARLWDTATGLAVGPTRVLRTSEAFNNGFGCFAPDGRSFFVRDGDMVERWDIVPPIEGTPERIRLAIEVATRQALDRFGGNYSLSATLLQQEPDPWEPVKKRLDDLGGPVGMLLRD
jgi:serine/threonine protein kinase/WD40 repeat protein